MEKKECSNLHPQSMCPAFGGLRVLMRIDGVQVCLVADQGCAYGLTFVSHFYAARKSIVTPELMNVQISGGTMIDDVRKTIEEIALDPAVKFIPVVSTCVAETAGIAEELLPSKAGNADVLLVRLPAFQLRTHPEAKDVTVATLLNRFAGANREKKKKSLAILGEIFPVDAMTIGSILQKIGVESVIVLPGTSLEDYGEAGCVEACAVLHPFYERSAQFFEENGAKIVRGNPIGANGTGEWIRRVGEALDLDRELVAEVADEERRKVREAMSRFGALEGSVIVAGYEGNELPVVRLLLEAGLDVPYASTSIARMPLGEEDHKVLSALGTEIRYRKYLEEDMDAVMRYKPDLVIGTTSLDSFAKEQGIPAIYYTNNISARPLFFAAGAATVLGMISGLLARKDVFRSMKEYFMSPPKNPQPIHG
ncbi:MAG: chlorophyllide a reductase subunit Y [Chlorobium sp.]|uniref:chlorophyllide a reductase subunit Y n=1 Tax=Chlorobium sp. TaxID=1095 RepID=UPI0025B7DA75|nr:chlorophyllide a reductase subunit Y [Chlorobium sp.]MCF8216102.1 chlorophyllide a reductase subunit Y [Chlorobium sp.]MCF8271003.1 chlorophyllide a reductase subunit Y [Chlorobium sp.]MCF8287351.1 chlorophyllide a reductase subunit Y [Chlorobium sp.]MCF8290916.1 chlorophyllide a reductase subunit Y [Chlorobium sp.]MCF8385011.1 chlorophyllide a reductase subunit Y [Chlorobium sp.]